MFAQVGGKRLTRVALVALATLLLSAPAWAALTLVTEWGSPGSADGQFNAPRGVAVNAAGDVYVVDGNNNRIQKFTAGGAFLLKFGSGGSGPGQFNSPNGVAIDPAGNVFIVDVGHYTVHAFTADGTFIRSFGTLSGTPSNPGSGEFDGSPEHIAIDRAGSVYVTDRYRVSKFAGDGTFIRAWGGQGTGDGQFGSAEGVAVDSQGNVYVADGGGTRVQKFDPDGRFLAKWGSAGSADGQLLDPEGIAVRSDGHVFVGDDGQRAVNEFAADGAFVARIRTVGPAPGEAFRPAGLAFGAEGDLFVTDINPNDGQRVLRLRDVPEPLPAPEVGRTANVEPVSGTVLIKMPPGTSARKYGLGAAQANGFVRLTAAAQVPLRSTLDTKSGRVKLQTAVGSSRPGQVQTGQFYDGVFQVRQTGGTARPFTEMVLNERLTCRSSRVQAAAARSRRLWGNGRGRFRTRGRYSTATVRGTVWLTKDTCSTTTTTVRTGTVVVRDLAKRRNVTVRRGGRYVARARVRR